MSRFLLSAVAAVALTATQVHATVYNDAVGENFDGNPHMDIASVEVTNTLSDITFAITLSGSVASPNDWGKYLVGISTNSATGDTGSPVGNPWGRNIRMDDGMDAFIGSWVDSGGGFQPYTYSGSWNQNGQFPVGIAGNTVTITTTLLSLGLTPGQTIQFDVYSTGGGGGDSANDAAANPNQTVNDWQVPYTTASGAGLVYEVAIPEPSSLALLGLGALTLIRRRR